MAGEDTAAAPEPERVDIEKIYAISYDDEPPANARDAEDKKTAGLFNDAGVIPPAYPIEDLVRRVEESSILRQCIDTMATNCDQFGYRLVPVIDLKAKDADQHIADAILLERLYDAAVTGRDDAAAPTEQEVAARRQVLELEMKKEHAWTTAFFDYCTDEYSFIELRARTRFDVESIGDGYWEVLRNGLGRIAELTHVVASTIRKLPKGDPQKVKVKIRVSPLALREVEKWRRFRRYVQICEGMKTYFKEFGDRRVMSAASGRYYTEAASEKANLAAMQAAEPNAKAATELWNFALYNPTGAYGLPRWIGNYFGVLGSRKAEYVNVLYFDNKAIPPLAVLVEGGRLAKECVSQFKDFIQNKLRGARNFHKAIILEAAPAEGAPAGATADGKVRIKIQPLTDAILKDGLFMEYDARNREKVGESFRLPKLLRGDSSDVNRATAEAALAFAEQQVFSGERNAFDYRMDRTILTDLDVRYHTFESRGPDLKNPEALATAVKALENCLVPNEQRVVAGDILGREYPPTEEAWGKQPFALTLAGANSGMGLLGDIEGAEKARQQGDVVELAKRLLAIRRAIVAAERTKAVAEFKAEKRAAEADEEPAHIAIPRAELAPFLAQE